MLVTQFFVLKTMTYYFCVGLFKIWQRCSARKTVAVGHCTTYTLKTVSLTAVHYDFSFNNLCSYIALHLAFCKVLYLWLTAKFTDLMQL